MRPLKRNAHPCDKNGKPISINEYQNALFPLIYNLGEYCSYCEMHLDSGLGVDHILTKKFDKDKKNEWTNFLLACPNCNSTKGIRLATPSSVYDPDHINNL